MEAIPDKEHDNKSDKNQRKQVTDNRGGFKPGPWPKGRRPDLVNHPMPGRIPAGWPNGEPVEVLTHPTQESDSE